MDPKQLIVVAVALVALLAIGWVFARRQRTFNLRKRFGPEYEHAVRESGPQQAETALLEREKRVQGYSIRALSAAECETFLNEWRTVQSRFVDDPAAAVGDADGLVDRLIQARGYPTSDFDQQAADISVEHPHAVHNYRTAHQITLRHQQGEGSTEDLRTALIHYRSLFDDLLRKETVEQKEVA
jgi:hypothetical protein